jgi:hypothetical protein
MSELDNYYINVQFIKINKIKGNHTDRPDVPLTISNIEIYETYSETDMSSLPVFASKLIMKEKLVSINKDNISTSSGFYKEKGVFEDSKSTDFNPSINIDLKKEYPVSKIVISIKNNTNKNIINTIFEILDSKNKRVYLKIIRDNDIKDNRITIYMKCPKCNSGILKCNNDCPICKYKTKDECPCKSFLMTNQTNVMKQNDDKILNINKEITQLNTFMNDLLVKQTSDLNKITSNVNKNKMDLQNINATLEPAVLSLGLLPKIIQINPPTVQENFTNYNYNYKDNNLNTNMMPVNSNDVSQFNRNVKSSKDKQMEKFANFIQPKINIYEGFTSEWQNDATFTSKIPYQTASTSITNPPNASGNLVRVSNIPIVKNPNMENNLNEHTAKILAMNIKNKANLLNGSLIK